MPHSFEEKQKPTLFAIYAPKEDRPAQRSATAACGTGSKVLATSSGTETTHDGWTSGGSRKTGHQIAFFKK